MPNKNSTYCTPAIFVETFVLEQIVTTSKYYNSPFEDITVPTEQNDW